MSSECSFEEKERIRRQEYFFAYVQREILLMRDRMADLLRYMQFGESSADTPLWRLREIEVRAKIEDRCERIKQDLDFCYRKSETSEMLTKSRREKAGIEPPLKLPNTRYYDKTEFPSSLVIYDEEEEEKKPDDVFDIREEMKKLRKQFGIKVEPVVDDDDDSNSGDTMPSKST